MIKRYFWFVSKNLGRYLFKMRHPFIIGQDIIWNFYSDLSESGSLFTKGSVGLLYLPKKVVRDYYLKVIIIQNFRVYCNLIPNPFYRFCKDLKKWTL